MITHKLSDFTIGFIPVPDKSYNILIRQNSTQSDLWYTQDLKVPNISNWIDLPLENWQIFSTDSREVTEEQAREVMPKKYSGHNEEGFPLFQLDGSTDECNVQFNKALESYNSMKVMLGVIDVNPYQRVPDFAFEEAEDINQIQGLNILRHKYNQAQSQVKRYVVVINRQGN